MRVTDCLGFGSTYRASFESGHGLSGQRKLQATRALAVFLCEVSALGVLHQAIEFYRAVDRRGPRIEAPRIRNVLPGGGVDQVRGTLQIDGGIADPCQADLAIV